MLLLLIVRYRDWRRALAAFLPSLLVPIIVLSGFALAGVETNLLHAVSLLIVMGMGVDYGIFIVDSAEERKRAGRDPGLVPALLLSRRCSRFGALALSTQPPLRAIGTTTGAGIALALVLAPVSLLVAAGRQDGDAACVSCAGSRSALALLAGGVQDAGCRRRSRSARRCRTSPTARASCAPRRRSRATG